MNGRIAKEKSRWEQKCVIMIQLYCFDVNYEAVVIYCFDAGVKLVILNDFANFDNWIIGPN